MANNKRSGGKTIGLKIYAVITSLLIAASAVVVGVGFGTGRWQIAPKDEPVQEQPDEEAGGAVIGEGEENGISLTSALIDPADYADYGVNALAETAYTVTITPEPADAVDTYTWTCDNTQQIQLSPSSDTKSCTVSCTGAFGTQATITIASAVNPDITATVTVDYVKRVESVTISVADDKIKFGGDSEYANTITITPNYGTGTITPEFTVTGRELKYDFTVTTRLNSTIPGFEEGYIEVSGYNYNFTGDTLSLITPYDFFVADTETSVIKHPSETQLAAAFNNSFAENATGTTSDGTLTISYSVSYNPESEDVQGSFSDTGTASVDVAFDVSELVVNASDITSSDSGLIY